MRHAILGVFTGILLTGWAVADTVSAGYALAGGPGEDGPELAAVGNAKPAAAPDEEATLGVLVISMEAPEVANDPAADSAEDQGYLDSLGLARVPLPAAAWLFGSAMIGIVAVSRRRPGKMFG